MAKQLMLVLSEPTAGREDDYNDWYENLHLDEVIATTPIRSAQRFVLADQRSKQAPHRYLALYEVEAEDPTAIFASIDEMCDQRRDSDALNRETIAYWVFTPIGERHEG